MGMLPADDFIKNLDDLKIACNNAERTVHNTSLNIPQKGIRRLFARTSIMSMKKLGKGVEKIGAVIKQYSVLEGALPTLNKKTVHKLAEDIKKVSESIAILAERQKAVSTKAQKAFSGLFFTQAGKELRKAKEEAKKANNSLVEQLQKPMQLLLEETKGLKTLLNDVTLGKTDSTKLGAEKSLKELDQAISNNQPFETILKKFAEATKRVQWADASDCELLFCRYNQLCEQAKQNEKSVYFFEPIFWDKYNSPELTGFAKKVISLNSLSQPFAAGNKSMYQECEELIKALELPGAGGDLLIPFLRFVVLKSQNAELLTEKFIAEIGRVADQVAELIAEENLNTNNSFEDEKKKYLESSEAFLRSFMVVLQSIKEEMHQDFAAQSAKADQVQKTSADTM